MGRCVAAWCKQQATSSTMSHRVTTQKKRRKRILELLGRDSRFITAAIAGKTDLQVCASHFPPGSWLPNGRLKPDANPMGMRRERVLSDPAVVTLASGRAERVNRRQTAENEREVPTDEHDDDQPFGQPLTIEEIQARLEQCAAESRDKDDALDAKDATIAELRQKLHELEQESMRLTRRHLASQVEGKKPQEQTIPLFSLEILRNNDEKVRSYTGLPGWDGLLYFLSLMKACGADNLTNGGGPRVRQVSALRRLSWENEFLLTLVYLRCGFSEIHVGYLFNVSQATVSTVFQARLTFMALILPKLFRMPDAGQIAEDAHRIFSENSRYRNTVLILDATEIRVETLSDHHLRQLLWSDYKSGHTAKWMVGLLPSMKVGLVSDAYGGSASDKLICETEDVFQHVSAGQAFMVDKGVSIKDRLRAKGAECHMPHFLRQGYRFTESECAKTREIASLRTHVERAIRRIKTFRWLKGPIPATQFKMLGKAFTVCAYLTNFLPGLIAN